MERISVRTGERVQVVLITREVQEIVARSGVEEGICVVYSPHTTAGITINEAADPSVIRDFLMETGKIVPFQDGYAHAEGNSAAHIKTSLVGPSVTIPVEGGTLALGTWQGIYFCEFDGPRTRKVFVQIIGR
ncbi:secondary thiamine-phosphate synthase enzyme YjbQ [Spirochaeta thermophila]|uniref:Automatic annotation n=1 Tax=Winmispira thermophila (strain ATCC 49972 / DSM 6192 / RI 19.B1) TaxID=665571 RepID=E0RTF0_WINT6|nr:secondary thiamine-phosphate synthase enzyme YjbQ [Spirochaeta thermophila]ADN01016.1 automatic annotation [Spirochaeta thermophila DSM 6192]